jgi:hypothetical protein
MVHERSDLEKFNELVSNLDMKNSPQKQSMVSADQIGLKKDSRSSKTLKFDGFENFPVKTDVKEFFVSVE